MSKVVDRQILNQVLPHFGCSLNNSTVSPLGNGLINQTYLVRNINAVFVLQCINKNVFKHPEQVIENAELINAHLLSKKDKGHYPLESISQLHNHEKSPMVIINGDYWRAIQYIPNCYTVESVTTTEQAQQVGTAFAQFTAALSDFPAATLAEIIPDFHNLNFRISELRAAIDNDPMNRLGLCQEIVDFCLAQHDFINHVTTITSQLPIHVTHNDTKINNLLFSSDTKNPIAVIDLDTCMPGYLMHDFGDMVRTCCSNLPEDGKNIEDMSVRMDIFAALIKAYIANFGNKMTPLEQKSLIIGAQLLPFMIGVRFLTDYLDGDNYFHVDHNTHNLERTKNQLQLYKLLRQNRAELANIITQPTHALEAVV
jgi:Ser/Thr protein kinase RdoA (MazF antagonist)